MPGNFLGTENILGYSVTTEEANACIDHMLQWIKSGETGRFLACANPHSLAIADHDKNFREALLNADILVPDGAGIVLASLLLKGSIRERITGSDIFYGLNAALDSLNGHSCFFLGSTEANLSSIAAKLKQDYPRVKLAGYHSPPYKPVFTENDTEKMISAINAAAPDVLWVGMTAPKQEKWIFENRHRLKVPAIVAIGAVFDFYIGNVKRSHPFFQRLGLEWLPRLIHEPARLWRRTFVSAPRFLLGVVRQRLLTK